MCEDRPAACSPLAHALPGVSHGDANLLYRSREVLGHVPENDAASAAADVKGRCRSVGKELP